MPLCNAYSTNAEAGGKSFFRGNSTKTVQLSKESAGDLQKKRAISCPTQLYAEAPVTITSGGSMNYLQGQALDLAGQLIGRIQAPRSFLAS
jgi:hypothetical protein